MSVTAADNTIMKITHKGGYGICEMGGEVISIDRLEAIAWTKYCISCEAKRESRP